MKVTTLTLNRWKVIWMFDRSFEYGANGIFIRKAQVGIVKVIAEPKEGVALSKKHYKGFLLRWYYWLPWAKA